MQASYLKNKKPARKVFTKNNQYKNNNSTLARESVIHHTFLFFSFGRERRLLK